MTRGVVLVSGGMDSCVTAAIAAGECRPAFLHVSYGQRTETRERSSFLAIAEHYGVVDRLEAQLDHLKAIGGSSLTDIGIPVEVAEPGRRGIPRTYVPFRNAQLLSIAVSWAEVIGATRVYIGAVEEDSSGYPDCRREFFDAFETMIHAGTLPETTISIRSPVIGMRKEAIVRKGLELAAPFHLTWSCYREERVACGTCDSCALRLRAFAEAGMTDPIPYAPASR